MKKRNVIVLIIIFIAFSAGFAFAQEETPFLQQLRLRLEENNWEKAEIQNMMQECRKLNWAGLDPSHAEIASLALKYGEKESEPLLLQEKALFAHQIALQSGEMKKAGLEKREIAGLVMRSTREMHQNIHQNKNMYDNPGEIIRECVQESIRKQLRLLTADKIKAKDGTADGSGNAYGKNEQVKPGKK